MLRRRKGCFSFCILALCVIYFTWLIQLKFTDSTHHRIEESHSRDVDLRFQKVLDNVNINNENKNIDINGHLNDRNLLIAKTQTLKPTDDNPKLNRLNANTDEINEKNVNSLFQYLNDIQAFLIDISILKEHFESKSNVLNLKINDDILTFGIYFKVLPRVNSQDLINQYNLKCEIKNTNGIYVNKSVITNIYLSCYSAKIQLAVFYERGEFLWIGSDEAKLHNPKWFGDIPRAYNKLNITRIEDANGHPVFIPADLKRFIFDYGHSKFLECNRTLADNNLAKIGPSFNQNIKKNEMLLPVIKHMASTLEGLYKHYWLAGGTLLGWYRDCGVIPHTQDVDFAVIAEEYDNRVKKAFLGNKIVRLWGTLGMVNDSYEFRMYNDLFTFDMFLVYKYNDTHRWCGYQVNKVKFRRWLPNFGNVLCSAELLNNKFMVPCDPVHYLNYEYGKEDSWIVPQASNYSWSNVRYSSMWSDDEWPHVIKYYDKQGKLIIPKILTYLNKHTSKNITKVPDEID